MDAKGKAIVAHITIIGLIISFILNNQEGEKDELTSFYNRQMLGLVVISFLMNIVLWVIPSVLISSIVFLILFVLWVISLLGAIQGEEKHIPVVGEQIQEMFSSVG